MCCKWCHKESKGQPIEWENFFCKLYIYKNLYLEHLKNFNHLKIKRINNQIKSGQRDGIDFSLKNIYKWPTVHEKVVNIIRHLENVIKSWDTISKSNIGNDVQFSYIESRRVERYNYFGKLVGQFLIKVNTHPPVIQ